MLKHFAIPTIKLLIVIFLMLKHVESNKEVLDSLTVQINGGPIRGYLAKSYDNQSYMAFEGIPFAKPPIGDLRFKAPENPSPWTSPIDANNTYICTQFLPIQLLGNGLIGQEDCLYINVYVPGTSLPKSSDALRDVIVHIHGGAFVLGAPRMMAGSRYIMNENVIYVSFNYRLNIFGFLSTNDAAASGNWGLKDQTLALKWIRANVAKFGGNPASITLTGHSAGSASVHYHILSSKSKNLFDKAVMLSGTALNPWALTERPLEKAQKLGEILKCSNEDTMKLVECLRKIPEKEIAISMKQFFKFANVLPVAPFGPSIEHEHEEAFISEMPYRLLKAGKVVNDVPMIISFVKDEGIFPSGYFAATGQIDNLKSKWNEVMPYGLDFHDTMNASDWEQSLNLIKDRYYPNDDLSTGNLANLTKLWTERFYLFAIDAAIRLHQKANTNPIFVYYFGYDSAGFNIFPGVKGVAHSEDLSLMFNLVISPSKLTEEDHEMSHFMTRILSNFAKNSIPMDSNEWQPLKKNGDDLELDCYEITKPNGNKMITMTELAPRTFWSQLPINENC